ncbi:MAG: gliding motility-associated C-terminal domain-containing protein [Bacteroidia bacterium]|nr:gliding motility-associated C-terminal domain-containing protein [Bacteroidia bacterium]
MKRNLLTRALLTAFLCIYASLLSAQVAEICNNGIDDDLDGLTDCNDPDCSGFPVPASNYFHTGKDGAGGFLPSGAQDIDWDVSINGPGGPYNPAIVLGPPATNPYAVSPWPDAQWISTNVNAADNSQFFINGNFVYYYRIQFFLPCVNACSTSVPANFCINMSFMVDNLITGIFVNGVAEAGVPPGGFGGFTPGSGANINLCSNFQAGLNTVLVEVMSPSGLAAFLAQTNVNAPPAPVPPVVNPVNGTICSNQSPVTVTANTPGGTWAASCGACIDPVSGAFDPIASGAGTFDVYYSVQNGTTCGSDTISVTVQPAPAVNAGPDVSVCPGDPVTLTASGADSYAWSNGVTNGVPFVPPATITYTVIGTATNTCQDTDQVVVTINPLGCPNFPNTYGCNINQIRQAFTAAGCIEIAGCVNSCSMYFLNPQSMSGSQAQAFAQTLGANLVSVESAAENQCLISALNNMGQGGVIWIGFNDELMENNFVWYDQSPVIYTNWAPGEPNNLNVENCTQIYPDGMWNDLDCNTANAQSVIEVNLCPVVNAGADTGICPGGTANLNASNALFGSNPYTYAWSNGVNGQPNPVSPAAGTSYSITITDRYQCTTSDTVNVTVYPLPPVNAGADTAICAGASVTLSGSGASTYTWDNGIGNGIAFTPATTLTYTLTGTDTNTCQNTDQVTVTVNPLPAVNAGADQAICAGDTLTLSGSGANTYTWDNGVTDGTAFVPTATTTYTVTGTDINTCQNTDQITITVNTLPAVSAGPDMVICSGDTVTLNGSGATSYTWNNGVTDGTAFVPAATTTYTVTGTDGNTCQNTDSMTVTVNPLPPVNGGPDQAVCAGTQVTLAGSGATSYTWNNGITDNTAFTPAATATYIVEGTDGNTCRNTDTVKVTVYILPPVNAGPDQTICAGDAATLTGSGASTYTWDNGVTDGVAFNPAATATYVVTGTDTNTCQNTDTVVVNVTPLPPTPVISAATDYCEGDAILLDANTIAGAQYFWNNGGLTEDLSFASAQLAHSGLYTVYVVASNCTSAQAQHTISVHPNYAPLIQASICSGSVYTFSGANYTAAGQYQVPFSTIYGCDSTTTIQLTLLTQPVANFDMPAQVNLSEPSVHVNSTAVNALSVYYWLSTGDTYNVPNFIHQFYQEGTYSITQAAINGQCSDTLTREIVVRPDSPPYIPNSFTPNNDGANDEWKPVIAFIKDYSLIIFDRWGERLFESEDIYTGWNGSWWNNVDKPVAQGTYVYKINYVDYNGKKHDIIGNINLIR